MFFVEARLDSIKVTISDVNFQVKLFQTHNYPRVLDNIVRVEAICYQMYVRL